MTSPSKYNLDLQFCWMGQSGICLYGYKDIGGGKQRLIGMNKHEVEQVTSHACLRARAPFSSQIYLIEGWKRWAKKARVVRRTWDNHQAFGVGASSSWSSPQVPKWVWEECCGAIFKTERGNIDPCFTEYTDVIDPI